MLYLMIHTVAVQGYRSLRDLLLPLGQLSVITGANGSGKSSVYRSLRLLADAALNSVVASIERMLARILSEDIAMSSLVAPDLGVIEADSGEVEQVLMYLVVNASDAMQSSERLVLEMAYSLVN